MELPIHLLNSTLVSAVSMGANITSSSLDLNEANTYCAQLIYTGTPTGTLKLQGSNDNSNWTDISGKSVALAGSAGSSFLSDTGFGYGFLRIVYTFTSGTGSLTATVNAKR